MAAKKEQGDVKIRFPLAVKLVSIITILLLASIGSITFLVAYFVSADVRVTAEENNFSANRRSASEAETRLSSIRSASLALLDILDALNPPSPPPPASPPAPAGGGSVPTTVPAAPGVSPAPAVPASPGGGNAASLAGRDISFFFNRHQDIAAILLAGGEEFLNAPYFQENGLDPALPRRFLNAQGEALERCRAGETLVLNAAPVFSAPALAMFCPREPGSGAEPAVVFFTVDSLTDNFGQGTNPSFMINDQGDLLVHPDYELARAGVNMANHPLVREMTASADDNRQTLYTGDDGARYFGAFQKLSVGGLAVITNMEYNLVFEGVNRTIRNILYLSGAVFFAAVMLIWVFSKSVSQPVKSLAAAARGIEAGQFEQTLKPRTRDEVGALTSSFVKMSGALGIFGRFTNREIAVRAMRGEIRPGGEAKNATVFFSDIRNFTALCEQFTLTFGDGAPDRIIQWLNAYFTRMIECVEKTQGVVDKFIGDSVMAHWGTAYTSGSPAHDALNAVRAALMMRAALLDMNRRRAAMDPGNPSIRIGCGINSGIVTAGQLGSIERMEYTVIGDPVNLASRVEALNKPLGTDILITENTWRLVGRYLLTEEMPSARVKGKEKPVRLFAVVNMRAATPGAGQPAPRTLAEVRKALGIKPPDLEKVDVNADERKYQIG
ncbi:MAG: HAMP domain-containing protein [Treponema sp.]|jgi:adenylate cyclase|nr:HAMP domain-containing protein [Treponema sp.]